MMGSRAGMCRAFSARRIGWVATWASGPGCDVLGLRPCEASFLRPCDVPGFRSCEALSAGKEPAWS